METKSRFILIKHEALKAGFHFDLRFKIPGKNDWDSFALPKGVPEGNKKNLAIRTMIHSEADALFTGKIVPGEYGGGTLSKEDFGSCNIIKYSKRHIIINFFGNKLKGIYHFINIRKEDHYLFFKGKIN